MDTQTTPAAAAPKPAPGAGVKPGEPYCSNCGYHLSGLTESSCCPECGRPLVEVLVRGRITWSRKGRRFRTEATLFGWPIVDVALGPSEDEMFGRARGIIAIGDRAVGWLAIGNQIAIGVVAFGGGAAIGAVAIGGGAGIGVLAACGGGAVGGLAVGGGAIGGIALGGGAIGGVAQGGAAAGYYARGGAVAGVHTITPIAVDAEAARMFKQLGWLLGPPGSPAGLLMPIGIIAAGAIGLSAAIGVAALLAHGRATRGRFGGARQ